MDQQEIRNKLISHMMKLEIGPTKVGPLIGISPITIASFISKNKNIKLVTLGRINNYLEKVSNN